MTMVLISPQLNSFPSNDKRWNLKALATADGVIAAAAMDQYGAVSSH